MATFNVQKCVKMHFTIEAPLDIALSALLTPDFRFCKFWMAKRDLNLKHNGYLKCWFQIRNAGRKSRVRWEVVFSSNLGSACRQRARNEFCSSPRGERLQRGAVELGSTVQAVLRRNLKGLFHGKLFCFGWPSFPSPLTQLTYIIISSSFYSFSWSATLI